MFFFQPFQDKDSYAILPALEVEIMRCPDETCAKVHGFTLFIKWLDIGIAAVWMFHHDDLV